MSNKGLVGGRKIFRRELEEDYNRKIEKRFEKSEINEVFNRMGSKLDKMMDILKPKL